HHTGYALQRLGDSRRAVRTAHTFDLQFSGSGHGQPPGLSIAPHLGRGIVNPYQRARSTFATVRATTPWSTVLGPGRRVRRRVAGGEGIVERVVEGSLALPYLLLRDLGRNVVGGRITSRKGVVERVVELALHCFASLVSRHRLPPGCDRSAFDGCFFYNGRGLVLRLQVLSAQQ